MSVAAANPCIPKAPTIYTLQSLEDLSLVKTPNDGDISVLAAEEGTQFWVYQFPFEGATDGINAIAGGPCRGAWVRGGDIENIVIFGAIPDSPNVQTEAIQRALNALAGGTVLVPEGQFITDGLTVPENTKIVGRQGSILKLRDAGNEVLLTLGEGATVQDLTLDGNKANQTSYGSRSYLNFSVIEVSDNCTVRNCTIRNAYSACIYGEGASDCVIEGNRISDSRIDPAFEFPAAAIRLEAGSNRNAIRFNRFSSNPTKAIALIGYNDGVFGSTTNNDNAITDNVMDFTGVASFPDITLSPASGANKFISSTSMGIEVWGGSHKTIVARNYIIGPLGAGIDSINTGTDTFTSTGHPLANGDSVYIFAQATPAPFISGTTYYVINRTANTFQLSATQGGAAINITTAGTGPIYVGRSRPYGISMDRSNDCIVESNYCIRSLVIGVENNGCSGTIISKNELRDCSTGVYIENNGGVDSNYVSVIDNKIFESRISPVLIETGTGHLISKNTITDAYNALNATFSVPCLIAVGTSGVTIEDNVLVWKRQLSPSPFNRSIFGADSDFVVVSNNKFFVAQDGGYVGVQCQPLYGTNCSFWSVNHNIFDGRNGAGAAGTDVAVQHTAPAESWTFSGNIARDFVDCFISPATVGPIVFIANKFSNCNDDIQSPKPTDTIIDTETRFTGLVTVYGGGYVTQQVDGSEAPFYALDVPGIVRARMSQDFDMIVRSATDQDRIGLINGGFLKGWQVADPGVSPAGTGFIYLRDNGAGKMQWVAQFPSGVVQPIATEP